MLDDLYNKIIKLHNKLNKSQCSKFAFKLCQMTNLSDEAQKHIDNAKDSLYLALEQIDKDIKK